MKRIGTIVAVFFLAVLVLSSCKRKEYVCQCYLWGVGLEEEPLGFMSNNLAQKKCIDYQEARVEDYRGTATTIRCKVIVDE